jgi:hypothetical protein
MRTGGDIRGRLPLREGCWFACSTSTVVEARDCVWLPCVDHGLSNRQVVPLIDGRTLKDFIREEIAEPLGADFRLGCTEQDWHHFSPVIPLPPIPTQLKMKPDIVPFKAMTRPMIDANKFNTDECKRAEMGAANGHTNARGVYKILSAVTLSGEVNGVRLISQKTLDLIFQ